MKLLLLGANGQVGHELARTLLPLGEVTTAARHGAMVHADLAEASSLQAALEACRPDWIINAAAYTAVDRAESEADLAHRVNGAAVGELARWANAHDAALVHFSTDYVFPGQLERPLREDDPVDPINAYGASKLAGEQAIGAAACNHLVFRTAWVYGNHGNNFLRTMLRLAASRPELGVVDDQRGAPTWSRMLAELTTQAIAAVIREGWRERSGIYHLSARNETTWHGFASRIFDRAAAAGRLDQPPLVKPVTTDAFPTPARRPSYSVLDNRRFEAAFGLHVPSWERQLDLCMQDFHRPHD
ncbi:MAG: dTDP-4-dehydrorhamnose reductase [Pseudomonadota bacterium]